MQSREQSLQWENLRIDLHPWLKEAIESLGYPTMTPVQASTIPLLCGNKDVVVEAVTGSGKTLAFLIPTLQKISTRLYHIENDEEDEDEPKVQKLKRGHMLSIILSPTRELAKQIQLVLNQILQYLPDYLLPRIKTQLLVGSLGKVREDIDEYLTNQPQILIGTPGRMLDFLGSQYVKTSSLEIVILDEADKLLDFSFEIDVVNILKKLPKQKRIGLFSATLSSAGDSIFKTGMNNPVKIQVKSKNNSVSQSTPTSLKLSYVMIDPEYKLTTLLHMLSNLQFKKSIVYFPTCTSVKHFYQIFNKLQVDNNIKFFSLHGQLTTKSRMKTLESFINGDINENKFVLMTTDVAARGIDVPDVDLVLQLDPPTDPNVFLHRCGRTGRANKVGQAIVMLNNNTQEEDYIGFMDVKNVVLNKIQTPTLPSNFGDSFQKKLINYMLEDRARHELGVKSYVGFVKYYSKHVASSIFRMASLDYLGYARMYGLIRLPKMPETKYIDNEKMPNEGWLIDTPLDMDKYAYLDKAQEKARLDNLQKEKEQKIADSKRRKELKVKNESWSSKVEKKDSKSERKEKMKRKREKIEKQLLENPSEDEDEVEQDWKDEIRQTKKKKKNGAELQGSFDDL